YRYFVYDTFCHHLVLHPFPTRRSSDLSCVRRNSCGISRRCEKRRCEERSPMWPRGAARVSEFEPCNGQGLRTSLSWPNPSSASRSEEHTSELQSPDHLVCRLLLEKKKK